MNKDCIICDIINNPKLLEDTILYENDLFIVKAAKGMVVSGHLLVIPKKHINSFAELSISQLKEVDNFCNEISKKLSYKLKKSVIFFEHGSLKNGRHPLSIVHAHLHIIPYDLTTYSEDKIISDCKMKKIENYKDILNAKYKDYCYFKNKNGNMYLSHSIDFPRSIIFKVISKQEYNDYDYEWRDEKNNLVSKLNETIILFNELFK